ncbi:hypothetical protein RND71_024539 [Anisodus tanguticus]|uniref:Uncharacterized protein n=1 Tax=Anisodus tanguticus TaxID=243964 RepID=A0AAE1V437_9SOLA|nr:hypothetical protein RND71_024539 [Anisodus tanguticus]
MGESEVKVDTSLKDQGNEFFKAGNYLKAAALYTQAIKKDPSNATLYRKVVILLLVCIVLATQMVNRAAAFLHLVKLSKALTDAKTTINLKPEWEKALAAFQIASKYNPQSSEVSKKIKTLTQLAKDKKRTEELKNMRSNVDIAKHFDTFKSELSEKYGAEDGWKDIFSYLVETVENAVKSWHETSKVDPRVYFFLNKEKTDTEKYAPAVNIDKAFESPHTHNNCFAFLRQYAEDSFAQAACLVTPKSIISYPQHLMSGSDKHMPKEFEIRMNLTCIFGRVWVKGDLDR